MQNKAEYSEEEGELQLVSIFFHDFLNPSLSITCCFRPHRLIIRGVLFSLKFLRLQFKFCLIEFRTWPELQQVQVQDKLGLA